MPTLERRFYWRGLILQWLGALVAVAGFLAHRVTYFYIGAAFFLLGWFLEICSRSNVTFWHKFYKSYPDLAYEWCKQSDGWMVVDEDLAAKPSRLFPKKDWVGPIRLCVPTLEGKIVEIYVRRDRIRQRQKEFLQFVQTFEN